MNGPDLLPQCTPLKQVIVKQTSAHSPHSMTAFFLAHLALLLYVQASSFRIARAMFRRLGFLQRQEQVRVISDAAAPLLKPRDIHAADGHMCVPKLPVVLITFVHNGLASQAGTVAENAQPSRLW